MIETYQIYHLYKELSKVAKMSDKTYAKFLKKTVKDIMTENYYQTPNEYLGYEEYIPIVNEINSGRIDFKEWIIYVLAEMGIKKRPGKKNLFTPFIVQKNIKLYSVNEIEKQQALINKKLDESVADNPFMEFSDEKFNPYTVKEKQKNDLYELIRKGTLNCFFYIDGLNKNKFVINEKEIDDPDYLRFFRFMKIIRHNIGK